MFVVIILVMGGGLASATSPTKPEVCPVPPLPPVECGPNAHYEKCSKICPPQNCSTLIDPYWLCENPGCKPGCRCDDGYYRDDRTGLCISRDECLAQCGPLERFVKDSSDCQRTCANYKVTGPRSLCKPFTGCVCQDGRVRLNDDATGACVLPKDCPCRKCPRREHWEDCPSVCANETCISKNKDYKCLLPAIPLPCKGRCICDKGYLRNHLGYCIPEKHCPIKNCPINEVWRCASMCPQDSCKRLEPGFKCPPGIISVCIPACACKDGYLRDDNGDCILRELCPASLRCDINEVAVECQAYPPQTCESVYTQYQQIEDPPCVPGCDCRPGYLRNKRNICVPSEFCPTVPPSQCGPNQEYRKCGTSCEPSCADLDNPRQVCTDQCVEGCFCKDPYVKDDRGNCVARDECPLPVCNKPNEIAKRCGSYCEMRTCEDYNRTDIVCPAVCVRGCFCREGYVRNAYGVCMRQEKCPRKPVCLQDHEEYQSCGSSCPDNCDNYLNTNRICTANCVAGCNCKKGYVRNLKDNTCIKPEQCPTKQCTGENEEFNSCASYCPVTCANRYTQGDWACITLCREACDCIPGTLRNDTGACVPVEECTPPVCRQNERYMKCGTACPLTCDNRKLTKCTRQCVEDCFCEEGLVRDRFMRCVKPEECEPVCPAGEVFNECSAHCQDTCENYHSSNRLCTYQCQSGCVCEKGTVRRKDGKCVRPTECTEVITCPADEIYDPCSAHCEATCEHHEPNRPCTTICKPGCRCRDGLVRRKDGKCVKLEQCNPACPPREHYDECNAHCEETCEWHGPDRVPCLPYCSGGCRCDDGLVRRSDGQCVKLEDCYQTQCGRNERWVDCVIGLCAPLTCDQLGFPIGCPGIIGPCDGGCVCVENYVRDSNNNCIPKENCPSCGNDFNATSGCGDHCMNQCPVKNPPKCKIPRPCQYNGCDCKKGYTYNPVIDRCVAKKDCPVPCNGDIYAEKVKCPNPCPATCAKPTIAVCKKMCLKEGCQCRTGYVLAPNGKCVRPENCPDNLGCNGDPNAIISSCVSLCEPQCGGGPIFCPAVCRLGCACKYGYILSKPGGPCIEKSKCDEATTNATTTDMHATGNTETTDDQHATGNTETTSDAHATGSTDTTQDNHATTGPEGPQNVSPPTSKLILCPQNEIWINCKAAHCKPEYCSDKGRNLVCALGYPDPCDGGCICKKGLLRNEEGDCIPEDQCPINKPCSDPNAIRKKCASHESCRATCAVPNSRICPKICIINGCECKKGYVLSEKGGKCIIIDDCPRDKNVTCNGDANAVIVAFPPPCPSTCKMPNGIPGCLKIGQDVGCQCKPGYLQSDDGGKCILPTECKGGNPCGPNADFFWCRVDCPNDYCPVDDSRTIIACDPAYPCPSGCVCKLNHKKLSLQNDTCIVSSTCPRVNCTRKNEYWDPCPSACLAESCRDVNNQPTTCNTLVFNCQPGCHCKKGHFRNDNDICVPAKECPNNQPCKDPNAERVECAPAPSCRSTCAVPNPSPCIQICAVNQCVCRKGYVLAEKGGKCVSVFKCPNNSTSTCNGDSNAMVVANPPACPPTCSNPNGSPGCKKYAPPVGCICKDGYIRAKNEGKCIKPQECPGGYPDCGANKTFVQCNFPCFSSYCPVDDQPVHTSCELPYPCPGGCACKINYKIRSRTDRRCILAAECPPINCTRPNEIFYPCPDECRRKRCEDINKPPVICNTLLLNCQPQCDCKKGYYKTFKGVCIPAKDCPQNRPCDDPNAERVECAPQRACRSTCGNPDPGFCEGGCAINECVCKKGYILSADRGKCIPVDKCPKDAPCNGDKNAVVKAKPIPCPSTCSSPDASPWCKRYAPPVGCVCRIGYLLDKNGKCIKPELCPGGNPCGQNETFVPCNFGCPTNNCPIVGSTVIVACKPPNPCPSGCACKVNYKRRSSTDRTCIALSDCPNNKCSDPNAERVQCALPENCRATCAKPNPGPCIEQICIKNECVCKKGYVLCKKGGKCVTLKQCPSTPIKCKANEVYNKCSTVCPPQTCASIYSSYDCSGAPKCVPGCECISGYLRNGTEKDLCIPSSQCPGPTPVCGDNEHYETDRNKCELTCDNYQLEPIVGACQATSGCFCDIGYVRDSNNVCIPKNKCYCKKGEVYNSCGSSCPPSCENKGNTCLMCTQQCVPGCYCAGKTIRAPDGSCVKPENCPPRKCTGRNEVFDECPETCPRTQDCKNLWSKEPCTPIDCCHPQCRCKPGFFRKDGVCVSAQECTTPPNQCGPNEVSTDCLNDCQKTCKNRFKNKVCTQICKGSGCICKPDYLRHDNGTCVEEYYCSPADCNKGEVYSSCGSSCPPSCKNKGNTCLVCTQQCVPGCYCAGKTIRAPDGSCVKPENCPPRKCTGRNEVFDECPETCPRTQDCKNLWSKEPCTPIDCCHPQCRCKPGFFRKDGVCVSAQECSEPPTTPKPECGLNEHYETNRIKCELTCKNYHLESIMGPCIPTSGCFCDDGYVRNPYGVCIRKNPYPPTIVCGPNEVLSNCYNSCHMTCKTRLRSDGRMCHLACIESGCLCKEGYLRHDNLTCVPINQCSTPIKCKANEVYNKCSTVCPPQTCASIYSSYDCSGAPKCVPGCECISGYLRNGTEKDLCIPSSQCPGPTPVCGDNEHYETDRNKCELTCDNYQLEPIVGACQATSGCFCDIGYVRDSNNVCIPKNKCYCKKGEVYNSCGSSCPPSCENKGNTCLMCTQQCVPGCYCAGKTIRAPDGSCVKPENCPPRKCTGRNEVFDECPETCPRTQDCKNLWSKEPCTPIDCCHPQCRCKPGFFRKDGVCVSAQECTTPPNQCGPNEVSTDCLNDCQKTCKNRFKNKVCTQICKGSGCICKPDYLRHDNGTCVEEYYCSPADCNKGEVYSSCGSSCPPSCKNKGNTCLVCTQQCVPGCYCAGKTIRAPDGSCVKPENCPPRKCTGRNEVFDECPETCPRTQDCKNLWSKEPCTPIDCCHPQCRCKPGFFRKDGVCVSAQECSEPPTTPKPECGLNEHYETNRIKCELTCKNYHLESIMGPCIPTSGCFCDDGYVRNPYGVCIRKNPYPPTIVCGPNEVLSNCYNSCHMTCKTRLRSDGRMCHLACIESGCLCKEGYLRHDNLTCVPINQCSPPKCNKNETYTTCGSACPATCQNRGDNCTACTDQCVEDCACSKGFIRADDGSCIKPKDCPKRICSDPNEIWNNCPPTCPPSDDCSNLVSKYDCTCAIKCCKPGCRCRPGYLRKNNVCVPIEKCFSSD